MKNNSHWLWCFGGGFSSGRKEENETLDSSSGGSFGGRVPAGRRRLKRGLLPRGMCIL